MKVLFVSAVLVLSLGIQASFARESRLKDGKPELAVAKVNGIVCWTKKEKDDLISSFTEFAGTSPVIVQDLNPTSLEVNLSTGGLKFESNSEFVSVRDDRNALDSKLDDLSPSKQKSLKSTVDILRSENGKR